MGEKKKKKLFKKKKNIPRTTHPPLKDNDVAVLQLRLGQRLVGPDALHHHCGIELDLLEDLDAVAGKVTMAQVREIAQTKMKDLNANDVEAAASMIAGTARSMGLQVVE